VEPYSLREGNLVEPYLLREKQCPLPVDHDEFILSVHCSYIFNNKGQTFRILFMPLLILKLRICRKIHQ
jgi:hypothetical protein